MTVRRVRRRFSERRITTSILRILRSTTLCSISTVAPGNRAHINTAYFAFSPDLELYFLSERASRHSGNLARNPSMAMTIFNTTQEWGGDDRGIQLFGTCRRARGRHVLDAERVYGKRFRTFAKLMKGRSDAERRRASLLRSYAFFRFVPTRVKILDEPEFGGGAFVVATIRRSRREKDGKRTVVRWQATHLYVPSPKAAEPGER